MEIRTPDGGQAGLAGTRELLARAAGISDDEDEAIIDRRRLPETLYRQQPPLRDQDLRDNGPAIVHGVAEALRRGEPEAFDAPRTRRTSSSATGGREAPRTGKQRRAWAWASILHASWWMRMVGASGSRAGWAWAASSPSACTLRRRL